MGEMVGQERVTFLTDLCRSLAQKTKTDLGAEPEAAVEHFLFRIEGIYRLRLEDVAQLTVDPKPILSELNRIHDALYDLVYAIDNLPYQVRTKMRWGMWESLSDEEFEKLGLDKPPIDEAKNIRPELLELQKKLSAAVKDGARAVSTFEEKKWTNKKLAGKRFANKKLTKKANK